MTDGRRKTRRSALLICELETFHAAHAEFNASVLATARSAFPASPIYFLASTRHYAMVSIELERHGIDGVGFVELAEPPASNWYSTRAYWLRTVRLIYGLSRQLDCSKILVCGFGEQFHHYFAILMPRSFHGRWCGLVHRASYLTRKKGRGLKYRLKECAIRFLTRNRRSRLIFLGPTIARHITENLAFSDVDVRWIYHPYLFPADACVSPLGDGRIDFVFAGRTAKEKGFDIFCRIADEISSASANPAINPVFTLAGGLRWVPREYSAGGNVRLADPALRLTRDDLAVQLHGASYLVMPYDASRYGRTSASGVLLDAISHVKPIIALRTDELSCYFELFGDLGILCESEVEMKQVVLEIIRNPPSIAYAAQQANLLAARAFLRVDNQKAAFAELWI